MGKKRMRRRFEASFKARVALAAMKEDRTLSELAAQYGVHANLISQWKRRLADNVARVFEEPDEGTASSEQESLVEELHRQIGQLHVELDWLKKKVARHGA
jgi:transposase-like protein